MSYATDRAWSDRFIPYMRQIVARYLIVPSSFEVDTTQAADLVVLTARNVTIACRVRRAIHERFRGQFTLRAVRPSGVDTELSKVVEGWGTWMLYGFEAFDGSSKLGWWDLLDLNVFRQWRESFPGELIPNTDGTKFRAYTIADYPPELVIGSSRRPDRPSRPEFAVPNGADQLSMWTPPASQMAAK